MKTNDAASGPRKTEYLVEGQKHILDLANSGHALSEISNAIRELVNSQTDGRYSIRSTVTEKELDRVRARTVESDGKMTGSGSVADLNLVG